MENPWSNLPLNNPHVLYCDSEIIDNFNRSNPDKYKLHLELLPEPYLGNPEAPVILLNLNPGYSNEDIIFHTERKFKQSSIDNLRQVECKYPFYLLNPQNSKSPGAKWWLKRFNHLINFSNLETVSKKVCCIEFLPYHSISYKTLNSVLFSQEYNFFLVREALKRRALIIIMRSEKEWLNSIPELKNYPYYKLRNKRMTWLSPGNLECLDKIKKILVK